MMVDMDSRMPDNGSMKTTVDIPENELKDAMRFTKAKTKREARHEDAARANSITRICLLLVNAVTGRRPPGQRSTARPGSLAAY